MGGGVVAARHCDQREVQTGDVQQAWLALQPLCVCLLAARDVNITPDRAFFGVVTAECCAVELHPDQRTVLAWHAGLCGKRAGACNLRIGLPAQLCEVFLAGIVHAGFLPSSSAKL